MAVTLPLGSIIRWNRNGVICEPTEHSRSELSVDFDRIKNSDRMANGRLREYYVADKRTWSVSWDMVPAPSAHTVDGKAGGADMEKFFKDTKGEFQMSIKHKDSDLDETVTVVFTGFDKAHVKRGAYDIWDVSVSMEEC